MRYFIALWWSSSPLPVVSAWAIVPEPSVPSWPWLWSWWSSEVFPVVPEWAMVLDPHPRRMSRSWRILSARSLNHFLSSLEKLSPGGPGGGSFGAWGALDA
jgi:hypothetical protein